MKEGYCNRDGSFIKTTFTTKGLTLNIGTYLEVEHLGHNDERYRLEAGSGAKDAETHGADGQPAWCGQALVTREEPTAQHCHTQTRGERCHG